MKKLFILLFMFCCSQMYAQIELTNQGVKWLEIYNKSNYNDIVNAISNAIGFRPVETTNDESMAGFYSTSKIASWTLQGTAGSKTVFEYKKTANSTLLEGTDYEACFTATYIFPIREKSQAQAKFEHVYKLIVNVTGNPKQKISPTQYKWDTPKYSCVLELKQEDNVWKVIETDSSKK